VTRYYQLNPLLSAFGAHSVNSTVPGKEEYQQIFQIRGAKPSHKRRNILLGIIVTVAVLAFFLLPIFDVETPSSSSVQNGWPISDASSGGSPSFVLFHCGLVVTTGTEVFPPAIGEQSEPKFPVDDFQWIC
jgi:hypothetical protein